MESFSGNEDRDESIGMLILESLLNSTIDSITKFDLAYNKSWFWCPLTSEERSGSVDFLAEILSKQAILQNLNLGFNSFSSSATQSILTKIADHPSTGSKF